MFNKPILVCMMLLFVNVPFVDFIWLNPIAMSKKRKPMNEECVDGSVSAMVRMMLIGSCLPVRGSTRMSWQYADERCVW